MGGFAAATYRAGGIDPTLNALVADDPAEFLAKASTIDAYANQRSEQLAAVAAEQQRLEQSRLLADEELSRLKAVEADLTRQQATIEKHLADAQQLLDSLEAEERSQLEAERVARERAAAAERASRGGGSEAPLPNVPASGKGQIAVDFALAQLGEPYSYGSEGPDCLGLLRADHDGLGAGRGLVATFLQCPNRGGHPGLAQSTGAGGPGVLLQPDQSRRHRFGRRSGGPRHPSR